MARGYKRRRKHGRSSAENLWIKSQRYRKGPGYQRTVGRYKIFQGSGGGEMKFFDQEINEGSLAANGTIFLNGSAEASILRIPQGTGESERIGRKLTIRKIAWRYEITIDLQVAATLTDQTIRVILYNDKQTNGTAATTTDILEQNDRFSFRNLTNSGRFRILYDKKHSISPLIAASDAGVWTSGQRTTCYKMYLDNLNIPVEYAALDGAIVELRSNNINMLIMTKTAATTTFASTMRIRYSDN